MLFGFLCESLVFGEQNSESLLFTCGGKPCPDPRSIRHHWWSSGLTLYFRCRGSQAARVRTSFGAEVLQMCLVLILLLLQMFLSSPIILCCCKCFYLVLILSYCQVTVPDRQLVSCYSCKLGENSIQFLFHSAAS